MRRFLGELLVLIPGSMLVGFLIGAIQHFVAFGALGGGFDRNALWLACFEGGIVGTVFGIPTGIITFYLALERHVTPRSVAIIIFIFGSLLAGCLGSLLGDRLLGDAFFGLSALMTPFLTFVIALLVARSRHLRLLH
ncbi:MAG: hypothetical protein ABR920_06080 [Terriglobales bacterium]